MAFNDMNSTTIGTKGSDVYTANGVNDPRVALSVLLVQGADESNITSGLDAILATGDRQMVEDAFVLAFQARDVRGGKGIRDVTQIMIKHLLSQPKWRPIMLDLLEKIPEYGSWRDLKLLGIFGYEALPGYADELITRVVKLFQDQLTQDWHFMVSDPTKVSLAAKYAPRECHDNRFEKILTKDLAKKLCSMDGPVLSHQLKSYRRIISQLNRVLDTTEVKMCGKHFAEIEPAKVAGRCLQKNMKAFLNQPSTYTKAKHPRPLSTPDRLACQEHFEEHFAKAARGEAKVNGSKTVFPHELIKKIVHGVGRVTYEWEDPSTVHTTMTEEERNALVAVWNQMVADAKAGGGLGRSLAMCDFSGSMQSSSSNGDTPYWVSMAMGLLISEVATDEFQDIFLTFDSQPTIHQLPKGDIFQRVASIHADLAQGTSTDFQKAMDLVLQRCKEQHIRPGYEPENLIVLTDMNWDQACGSDRPSLYTGNRYRHHVKTDAWQTHVEMIRESFKRAGEDMWGPGNGLKMPRIVIWNIAASSTDFHATADTEGVIMLSGWSPSLFKVLQKEGVILQTPYQALRVQLDDERYEPVRQRVRSLYKPTRM
jgi:hypothetical protein